MRKAKMEMPSCNFLRNAYEEAVNKKTFVKKHYQDAQDIYFPENEDFYQVNRTTIADMDNKASRCFNDLIPETAERYARQVERSLFPKGQTWSTLDKLDATAEEKTTFDDASSRVMQYLEVSNFYQEIARVCDDLVVGTGCLKQYPTGDIENPIGYTHVPLSQVYALVDGLHTPRTVFYVRREVTMSQLRDVYGEEVVQFRDTETDEYIDKIDIIECCHRVSKGKYLFVIYDEKFSQKMYEKVRPMPTFIFARHKKTNSDQVWGWGLGMKKLPLAYQLNYISQLNALGAGRAIDPPVLYPVKSGGKDGSQAGASNYMLKMKNGHVTPVSVTDFYTGGQFIHPMYPQSGYTVGLDHKRDLENNLRQGFFIDQLADQPNQDNKYRTLGELNLRDERFLEYFSSYYNNLERELIVEVFKGAIIMLQEYTSDAIIKKVKLKDASVRFVNPIVKFRKLVKLRELEQAINAVKAIAGPEVAMASLNTEEFLKLVQESYSLDEKLMLKGEDLEAQVQGIADAKEGALEMGQAPPVAQEELM